MAATSARTLQLLSLLQTHRFWPGEELATRLDVSTRTLRRDVDRLRNLGYPVDARPGANGGYQLAPGASLPPLVVDDDEAVALTLGLLSVANGPFAGMTEASLRAVAKVVQVLPRRLRRRVESLQTATEQVIWAPPAIDATTLTAIAQSCRDAERLTFHYAAADGAQSTRDVEPHRLVSVGRRWYLVAYDRDRLDWRSFRLDRLTEPVGLRSSFVPRRLPATDATSFVRAGLRNAPRTYTVEALVEADAQVVRARIGRWADVVEQDDGGCAVAIHTDAFEWALFGLLALDAPFTVIGPAEFGTHVRSRARRMLRSLRA